MKFVVEELNGIWYAWWKTNIDATVSGTKAVDALCALLHVPKIKEDERTECPCCGDNLPIIDKEKEGAEPHKTPLLDRKKWKEIRWDILYREGKGRYDK